jgi:hypothetical protein
MRIAAAQKQQLAFMVLLTGVSLAVSNMLAAASTEHTHAIGSNTFIIVRIMEPFWLVCPLVYLLPIVTPASQPKAV